MPLETTLWDVTDGMASERCRLAFLFACVEGDPNDDAFFASAVKDVLRSRKRYGSTRRHPMTLERLEKTMAVFPTVSFQSVTRIVEALGYMFDISPLAPEMRSKRPQRAAAKRTRPATRTQRRHA